MRKSAGQSLVEFALILPLLFMLLFGIIDLGWYVFNYAQVNQAVRNGAEVAAQLPPYPEVLNNTTYQNNDPCYRRIAKAAQDQAIIENVRDLLSVSYPTGSRNIGEPIQVQITYTIQPLTPLFQTLIPIGNNGQFIFTARSVRSIESLGFIPPTTEDPDGDVCYQP
jgi:hypothetical protein